MSDEESKTEHASSKRLEDAFRKGDVPLSRDAVVVSALAGGVFALSSVGPRVRDGLLALISQSLKTCDRPAFGDLLALGARPLLWALLPCAAAPLCATLVTLAQTRGGFWFEKAMPDATRLFSTERLTRVFKREMLADLGLALVKIVALGAVIFVSVRSDFMALVAMFRAPTSALLGAVLTPAIHAAGKVLGTLGILSGMDLAMTHLRFHARMKMTKDELRREAKEEDGDPLVRSRRRRKHRELSKARAVVEVPRADALLVNPTHVAVAIRYRRGEDKAPRVTAKGKGQLAEIMRDVARANGIPIVENIPLARLLHRKVKPGGLVPADTYKAIASVLAFVYRVTNQNRQGAAP